MGGVNFTVKIDDAELKQKLEQLGTRLSAALEMAGYAGCQPIVEAAEQSEPRSGVRAVPHHVTRTRVDMQIGVPPDKFYYTILEVGASAHAEKPRKAQALAFPGYTHDVVTTKPVQHPGIEANPWMRPAFDAKHREAVERAGETLHKVVLVLVK